MEIHVSKTFWGRSDKRFSVRTIDKDGIVEYEGAHTMCDWTFELHAENKLILESQQIRLSFKESFFYGREEYRIIWERKEIGILKKSLRNKEIFAGDERYPIPGFFLPDIPGLDLLLPFSAFLRRRKTRSCCLETEPNKIMLSLAITIYFWLSWNSDPWKVM